MNQHVINDQRKRLDKAVELLDMAARAEVVGPDTRAVLVADAARLVGIVHRALTADAATGGD